MDCIAIFEGFNSNFIWLLVSAIVRSSVAGASYIITRSMVKHGWKYTMVMFISSWYFGLPRVICSIFIWLGLPLLSTSQNKWSTSEISTVGQQLMQLSFLLSSRAEDFRVDGRHGFSRNTWDFRFWHTMSIGMIIPNIWENKKCSKMFPTTNQYTSYLSTFRNARDFRFWHTIIPIILATQLVWRHWPDNALAVSQAGSQSKPSKKQRAKPIFGPRRHEVFGLTVQPKDDLDDGDNFSMNRPWQWKKTYHQSKKVMTGGWCKWHCFNHNYGIMELQGGAPSSLAKLVYKYYN